MSNMARPQVTANELANATWRKSSFSNDQGQCVETAALSNGGIAVRNSNYPDAGAVVFSRAEMSAWINGCKAGEFDDLAQS